MPGDGGLEFVRCWEPRKLLQQPGLFYGLEAILSLQQVLDIVNSNLTRGGDDMGSSWRRDVLLLGENRMIHWSSEADLNRSCSFISAQMKHSASNQDPTLF